MIHPFLFYNTQRKRLSKLFRNSESRLYNVYNSITRQDGNTERLYIKGLPFLLPFSIGEALHYCAPMHKKYESLFLQQLFEKSIQLFIQAFQQTIIQ